MQFASRCELPPEQHSKPRGDQGSCQWDVGDQLNQPAFGLSSDDKTCSGMVWSTWSYGNSLGLQINSLQKNAFLVAELLDRMYQLTSFL